MSVRRERRRDPATGVVREFWMVDVDFEHPNGERTRVRKVSPVQTRRGAEEYERQIRGELLSGAFGKRKEVPSFEEWFNGRFWTEWVVARKNKPSTVEEKKCIYAVHLGPRFGSLRLDQIDDAEVARFRASLVTANTGEKRTNNILAVLSKPLRYAESVGVLSRAPRIGMLKVEPPEVDPWDLEQYVQLLTWVRAHEAPRWYAALCLAGELGLRIGEVKALDWKRDVDMRSRTVTVQRQIRKGEETTPKGRTRRTVPMTDTLWQALRDLSELRTGWVIRNDDGSQTTDDQSKNKIYDLCRWAGLPGSGWHRLRHTFATHAAQFGVNPWTLQSWMGHKTMTETMRYVSFAKNHQRPIPEVILAAGGRETDPDRKVLAMLGARVRCAGGNLTATSGEAG